MLTYGSIVSSSPITGSHLEIVFRGEVKLPSPVNYCGSDFNNH